MRISDWSSDVCSSDLLEPDSHVRLHEAARRGLTRVLCPSFIASTAGHPFWAHVARQATASRDDADVLDATGPYFLTGCHDSFPGQSAPRLLPAATLYPADKYDCWSGRVHDLRRKRVVGGKKLAAL